MTLFWRALNVINDAFAGAPDPIRNGALIAFAIGLLVAWALISTRIPRVGLVLNVAIVALVVVEVLVVRAAPPPRGDYADLFKPLAALFWAGQALIAILGVVGLVSAISRLVEKLALEEGDAVDLPRTRRRARFGLSHRHQNR